MQEVSRLKGRRQFAALIGWALLVATFSALPALAQNSPDVGAIRKEFAAKDATIADLRQQVATLTAQVETLTAQLAAMKAQMGGTGAPTLSTLPVTGNINAVDQNGMTRLMLAIQVHDAETAKALLAQGADVQAQDNGGNTALMLAAQWGNREVVKWLLDKGAAVDVKNKHSPNDNGGGVTALMWAARYGHVAVINLLLDKGASLTLGDNGGHGGALFWSASYGEAAATQLLLSRGAPVNAADKDGKTALYWAERPYPGVADNAKNQTVSVLRNAGGKS